MFLQPCRSKLSKIFLILYACVEQVILIDGSIEHKLPDMSRANLEREGQPSVTLILRKSYWRRSALFKAYKSK